MEENLFPLGLVYKRYSWRTRDFMYEVIEEIVKAEDNYHYKLIMACNDECRCFTSSHKHQLKDLFERKTCCFLEEGEFEEFEKNHPNILKRLKDKGISGFLRLC